MGRINWTKTFKRSDDGSALSGADLGNIQTDITDVVNSGISNVNISRKAGIVESKIAFDTSSGHDHDGENSALTSGFTGIKDLEGREGLRVEYNAADSVTVTAGSIMINETLYTETSANTVSNSNFDTASSYIYIYCYNNSGSLGFIDDGNPPNLTNFAQDTDGDIFRYRVINISGTDTVCRCLGSIYNDGDQNMKSDTEVSFDASSICQGVIDTAVQTGSNEYRIFTVNTLWTPDYLIWTDNSGDNKWQIATRNMFNYYSFHEYKGDAAPGVYGPDNDVAIPELTTMTEQAAGTAGSFTIDEDAGTSEVWWIAFSEKLGAQL